MTIVANDSITVSNVNDGTITHTAWAYSADGTDRFTTVYPNLNLLTNTTFKNYIPKIQQYLSMVIKNGGVNNEPYVSISYNNPTEKSYTDTISWGFDKEYFKPSTTYTFSFYLKGNGTIRTFVYPSLIDTSSVNGLADDKLIRPNSDGNYDWNLTSEWVRHTYTFITKSSITATQNFLFRIFTGNSVDICLPKLEEGSIATPYMQSASEVSANDYPRYRGEYSDFSSTASTNPSKYTWGPIRGDDGIAGNDGVGINSTTITYAVSTSGTTAPSTGWTSSVPTLVKGQYLWTKTVWTYTDNSSKTGYSVTYISKDGTDGDDGLPGKDGVGIATTTITYAGSTSGTTAPSTGWTSAVPTVPAGSYLWTKTVWTYTDNTSETGYSVAMMGVKGERGKQIFKSSYESIPNGTGHYWSDLRPAPSIDNPPKIGDTVISPSGNILQIDTVIVGGEGNGGGTFGVGDVLGNIKGPSGTDGTSGIIVSSAAPASPQSGQLWQDTSTTPQLVKKWNGTEWVIWELYAQNLKADTLETLSAKIGKVYNEFDNSSGGIDNKGTITIEDSIKVDYYNGNSHTTMDLVASSSGQGLFTQHLPDKTDASKFKQSWYMPTGLYFTDSINNFTGQITAENVSLSSWQNLILNSGYTAGDGVQPQYRRIKNLDGSYSVQFRGAVSPTSGNFPTSQVQVATLSGIYLPPTNAMRQCSDNTGKGGRVAATPSGKLYIWAPNTSSYMYIDALTYIN